MEENIKFIQVNTCVVVSEDIVRKWLKTLRLDYTRELTNKDYVDYAEHEFNRGHGCTANVIM